MTPDSWTLLLSSGLFLALLASLEIGFRMARSSGRRNPECAHEGTGAIEAAVFALLGLLLGFSFAGGTTRLEEKQHLVVREANAIGTAYLRLDLLPADAQTPMRTLFRNYIDARLRLYRVLPDRVAADRELRAASALQQQIWNAAVAESKADPTHDVARLLLPALNDMIDITTDRSVALRTHLPALIFWLLMAVALLSGVLGGYALQKRKRRSYAHMILYAAVVSITIYAILDLDSPRSGLIRLDAADQAMIALRDSLR
jgi:hypothetical protein